jgi:DNA-binding transcriptional ArsR family regulator
MRADSISSHAERFAALGAEPRLAILRLLLSAHPRGLNVGEIQKELDIPASTLSHHLERLRHEDLVTVRRDRQFLWYAANTDVLKGLIAFLYAECCTRTHAVPASSLVEICNNPTGETP